jgi:hypothetical protein
MRNILILALFGSLAAGTSAHADQAGWCAAYARDFADARTTDKALWQHKYEIAQKSCLDGQVSSAPVADVKKVDTPAVASAAPAVKAAAIPAPKAVAPAAAPVPEKKKVASGAPQPGTPEWNDYCAKKYTSFNPATGTYKSLTGVERKCLYTG